MSKGNEAGVCEFCDKDFTALGRHQWRCKDRTSTTVTIDNIPRDIDTYSIATSPNSANNRAIEKETSSLVHLHDSDYNVFSQFQLGTSPLPGQPRGKFFERANPGHSGKLFCLMPCPGAKNYCRIPQSWGEIFPNSKKLLRIKLAKVLKKLRRLQDSKTTRRSLNTPPSLDIQLKQLIYE